MYSTDPSQMEGGVAANWNGSELQRNFLQTHFTGLR